MARKKAAEAVTEQPTETAEGAAGSTLDSFLAEEGILQAPEKEAEDIPFDDAPTTAPKGRDVETIFPGIRRVDF